MSKQHLEPSGFRMYVHNAAQKEIAATLGVSEVTVTAWKRKHNWDERKEIEIQSTQYTVTKLKRMLADYVAKIERLEDDDKIGDKLSKITASIERLDSHFDLLGSVIKVSEEWVSWASANDDELFKAMQRALPKFLAHARTKFNR